MPIKLMVVDDEIEICDFVKAFFLERDFDVFTAYNGQEAVTLAEAEEPHIVLLDIIMPVMDGIETLKEMRKRGKKCKIIMVTAVEDAGRCKEAEEYGAIGYVMKPLSLEALERSVFKLAEDIRGMMV